MLYDAMHLPQVVTVCGPVIAVRLCVTYYDCFAVLGADHYC